MTKIAVINANSGVSDAEIQKWMMAVAGQLANEFFDAWGIGVNTIMRFIGPGMKPDPDEWWVSCLANSDVADALGLHDQTPTGQPLGKVFVETTIKDGDSASVCFSHEVLELLVDPFINLMAQSRDGRIYALEVCDAIEADACGYVSAINGVLLSDFVTPAWFSDTPTWAPGTKFDYTGHVAKPFQLAPEGYISVFENNGWTQVNADRGAMRRRPRVGSRRERRMTGRQSWLNSTKVF